MRIRRYLPNLSLLLAFDGVMRHGSVTAAAQELGLTQSTVSRLVQTLEEQMGQPLFGRHRRRLVPTEAAVRYHRDISAALDLIQQGGMSLIANPRAAASTWPCCRPLGHAGWRRACQPSWRGIPGSW